MFRVASEKDEDFGGSGIKVVALISFARKAAKLAISNGRAGERLSLLVRPSDLLRLLVHA